MIFLGAGPGNGIQLTKGEHEGRLVFPVYFINENNRQASAVIYSDDNGKTWHRGESPNEGRVVKDGETINERDFENYNYEITEAQVVEMPDGQLKMFMRNHSGYAQIATSFDGGETWDSKVVTEEDLVAPYSQMSAIKYEGRIDGKEAIIFSSANDHTSRVDGTVRAGLIEENGTYDNGHVKYNIDWKYEQLVKEGTYGYSSLTNLADGDIGLFYEGTANTEMDYIRFNTEYLKWDKFHAAPTPEIDSFKVIPKSPNVYRPGDKLQVQLTFDDYVLLMGDKELNGTIGETEIDLNFTGKSDQGNYLFEGTIPDIPPRSYELNLNLNENMSVYNVYGETLDSDRKLNGKVNIAADPKN